MQSLFTKEPINATRQLEIDIVRGLAVFFMLLVHVTGEFLDESANNTVFAKVIDFMGSIPAAPVFMFVMGVGFVYSKNQQPQKLFKRGLLIFFSGYVLNFLRGFFPLYIGSRLGYYTLNLDGLEWYHFLVEVDILQFAGLSMIFVSILKAIKVNELLYPVIAVFVGIISPYLWGLSTGYTIVDVFVAIFFGGTAYTFHPLFSWIFYPLIGVSFGWFLLRTTNKNRFYFFSSIISIVVIAIGLLYSFIVQNVDFGIVTGDTYNYYHHGISSNIIFCGSVILWISAWHFVSSKIPAFLKNTLLFWSKSVTIIYFVHWIIIGWCSFLVFDTFNIPQSILAMFILVLLTDRITDLYIKIKERLSECEEIDIPAVQR